MSVTQDYKTVTLTSMQCSELVAAARHRRDELQELIGSGLLGEVACAGIKDAREALFYAIVELSK